ncbi:MAG: C25 family cysteine peptidase, partial [Planctomycetota bacterium]
MNLSLINDNEDEGIPNSLSEVRFDKQAGATTAQNVLGAIVPINFSLRTGDFGTVAADGESGDEDTDNVITWSTTSTWVALSEFKVEGDIPNDLVKVLWETESETGNLGFHVYRSDDRHGSYVRLTDSLISPAVTMEASLTGYSYRYDDPVPVAGSIWYYKIEDWDGEGHRTMHGPVCVDWDGDGLPDDWEIANGFNNLDPADAVLDSDGDGLTNLEEYRLGLDPRSGDSDGDGVPDNLEGNTLWDGPVIAGINAGGEGLKVIGQDPYGMTLELECSELKAERVTREYAGWVEDEVRPGHAPASAPGLFKNRWKPMDMVSLRYGAMPTEYEVEVGRPRLPVKRVLLNVPRGRVLATRVLSETWGADIDVAGVVGSRAYGSWVEPVPESVDRPALKTVVKKAQRTIKQKVKKTVKKDVTVLTGYQRKKQMWSKLWGGESYVTEFVEETKTIEEEVTVEEAKIEEYDEYSQIPGSAVVEVYGLKRGPYGVHTDAPAGHFSVGERAVAGADDAYLLTIHNVKYSPQAGRVRHLSRLRFRVDYVWDPGVADESVDAWRVTYDGVNASKPAYLDAAEAYEIKVRKPAFSDIGNLHDAFIHKLTYANLSSAGMSAGEVAALQADPSGMRIYQGNVELSLKEVADGFVFFVDAGQNETLYSDRVTLYGVVGASGTGKRWDGAMSEAGFDQEVTEFRQRVRHELNNSYNYMESSPDTLFVNSLSSFGSQLRSYSFQTPGILGGGPVDLRVRMYGGFDQDPDIDQGAFLQLNSEVAPYASPSWGGLRWHTEASKCDASRFVDGVNTLKMTGYIPAGITQTRVRLDHIEVGYPRRLVAKSDRLLVEAGLAAGVTKLSASGFTDSGVIGVYDVTDASNVVEITGGVRGVGTVTVHVRRDAVADGVVIPDFLRGDSDYGYDDINGRSSMGYGVQTMAPYQQEGVTGRKSAPRGMYEGSYEVVDGGLRHVGSRILFANLNDARGVEAVKKVVKTEIRGRRTDVDHLIVVDESMAGSAQRLVSELSGELLEDSGLVSNDPGVGAQPAAPSHAQVVEMVTFQDLCKEYTQGEYSSAAIHEYVKERWRTSYRKPRFLTLIGTGNINTKGVFNFPLRPALVPSLVLRGGVKAAACDGLYGLITGDAYPDVAVGRLDASSVGELEIMIDKIVAYRDNAAPAAKKALLLGDHDPNFHPAVFTEQLDRMAGSLESDWVYEKSYRTQVGAGAMTATLVTELNASRVNLLIFNGHGNFQDWGLDLFWRVSSMSQLGVGHWTPVILEANCMSADYFHVAQKCLGSAWQTADRSGAAAVIGTTGRTTPTAKQEGLSATLEALVKLGYPRVGEALLRGKITALTKDPGDRVRAIQAMTLLGLPSMG